MKKRCCVFALSLMLFLTLNVFGLNVAPVRVYAAFANSGYEFTAIDGTGVSTRAGTEKVTVLIFGRPSCYNSASTVQSIAQSDWVKSPDVRVIFADIDGNALETVKEFADGFENEYIRFCYSTGRDISSAMWNYAKESGYEGSVTLPVIVLIDGNDQVQDVLTGYWKEGELLKEIQKFADIMTVDQESGPDSALTLSISGTQNYTYVQEVFTLVNQARNAQGLSPLNLDAELTEAAMQRAAEQAFYYSHTRPDGSSCFTISSRGNASAENIAAAYASPQDVMTGWMNSPGHYANIISDDMKSIGIGCFRDSEGIWYWVQYFDDVDSFDMTLTGEVQATRTVQVSKSMLSLMNQDSRDIQNFSCAGSQYTEQMKVANVNAGWLYSHPSLPVSEFTYSSSNPDVATVDASGVITVKAAGTAVITAQLKADPTLSIQRTIIKAGHDYVSEKVEATAQSEGYTEHTCKGCGDSYRDSYTAKLEAGPKEEQTTAESEATETTAATVKPKKQTISSLKSTKSKSLTVKWKKDTKATGYIIQYSTDKNFKKKVYTKTIKKNGTIKKTISGLKGGKKYYVRVCSYKTSGKKKIKGSYSKARAVTVKK